MTRLNGGPNEERTASGSALPALDALPPLGSRLRDRYRLDSFLGRGGAAVVYRGFDEVLESQVAIKLLLKTGDFATPEARALQLSLRVEALSAMRLSHPNVLRVFTYERHANWEFLVMELVEGEDLNRHCRARPERRLTPTETVKVGLECLEALSYAHAQGVTHNDIKPSNILLTAAGGTKLCDFGLARVRSMKAAAAPSTAAGTPAYMSPELISGQRNEPRSDLYCLAATLYTLGNGGAPFGTGEQAMQHHLRSAPPPSRHLPKRIDAVLRISLAKRAEERFPDAASMATELKRAIAAVEARPAARHTAPSLLPAVSSATTSAPAPPPIAPVKEEELQLIVDVAPIERQGFCSLPARSLRSAYGGVHAVRAFQLSKTLVTNEEYAAFLQATGAPAPTDWIRGQPPLDRLRHPVVGVPFELAWGYARWKGLRLPTGLEWEAAARGAAHASFPWGEDSDASRYVGPGGAHQGTAPVDSHPEGATPEGILHLVGNVWEWTENDPGQPPPPVGQAWVYGGSFRHEGISQGCIARTSVTCGKAYEYLGFRLAGDTGETA